LLTRLGDGGGSFVRRPLNVWIFAPGVSPLWMTAHFLSLSPGYGTVYLMMSQPQHQWSTFVIVSIKSHLFCISYVDFHI
jgi:hypothetical protein